MCDPSKIVPTVTVYCLRQAAHFQSRQPDGGGGVARGGLDQQVPGRDLGKLLPDQAGVELTGDNQGSGCGYERRVPLPSFLEETLVASQPEELLWHTLPRQRPEARAASACEEREEERR